MTCESCVGTGYQYSHCKCGNCDGTGELCGYCEKPDSRCTCDEDRENGTEREYLR